MSVPSHAIVADLTGNGVLRVETRVENRRLVSLRLALGRQSKPLQDANDVVLGQWDTHVVLVIDPSGSCNSALVSYDTLEGTLLMYTFYVSQLLAPAIQGRVDFRWERREPNNLVVDFQTGIVVMIGGPSLGPIIDDLDAGFRQLTQSP